MALRCQQSLRRVRAQRDVRRASRVVVASGSRREDEQVVARLVAQFVRLVAAQFAASDATSMMPAQLVRRGGQATLASGEQDAWNPER